MEVKEQTTDKPELLDLIDRLREQKNRLGSTVSLIDGKLNNILLIPKKTAGQGGEEVKATPTCAVDDIGSIIAEFEAIIRRLEDSENHLCRII